VPGRALAPRREDLHDLRRHVGDPAARHRTRDLGRPDPLRPMAEPAEIHLHGHRLSYRIVGRGPLLVLVHGITGSSAAWEPVLAQLGRRFTVIAPDLLGHGDSAKPRGDYSL